MPCNHFVILSCLNVHYGKLQHFESNETTVTSDCWASFIVVSQIQCFPIPKDVIGHEDLNHHQSNAKSSEFESFSFAEIVGGIWQPSAMPIESMTNTCQLETLQVPP